MKVLHNNRCRKSREAINYLEEQNIDFEIVHYLDGVLTRDDVAELVQKLNLPAESIVRKGETIYKENFKGKKLNNEEWIKALTANPKLIERPILYTEKSAVVGRPIENVIKFVKENAK